MAYIFFSAQRWQQLSLRRKENGIYKSTRIKDTIYHSLHSLEFCEEGTYRVVEASSLSKGEASVLLEGRKGVLSGN